MLKLKAVTFVKEMCSGSTTGSVRLAPVADHQFF